MLRILLGMAQLEAVRVKMTADKLHFNQHFLVSHTYRKAVQLRTWGKQELEMVNKEKFKECFFFFFFNQNREQQTGLLVYGVNWVKRGLF